jgi:acetyl-CoA carboxylase biotin carboxyl carrier protein
VADDLSSLSEDDVSQLVQVIECLENSAFDFLQLEVGGMKVVLGKGNPSDYLATQAAPRAASNAPVAPVATAPAAAPPEAAPARPAVAPAPSPAMPAAGAPADGTVEISSPLMGIFYAQPEPGAPPFVAIGSTVESDMTVGLVEVMKMFNAVPAGVNGTVVAVLVKDNELVEYGQPLFRIQPL